MISDKSIYNQTCVSSALTTCHVKICHICVKRLLLSPYWLFKNLKKKKTTLTDDVFWESKKKIQEIVFKAKLQYIGFELKLIKWMQRGGEEEEGFVFENINETETFDK